VYIIPTIYEDYSNLEHDAARKASLSVGDSNGPGQVAGDEFVRNTMSTVYRKAEELKVNSSVVSFCALCFFCDAVNVFDAVSVFCYILFAVLQ